MFLFGYLSDPELDGRAVPRIIDFGVAKALSQKLTADTIFTRVGALIGTSGVLKRFRDCGEFRAPSLEGFVGLPVKDTGAYPCRIPSIRLCWTFGSKTVM